MALSGAKTRGTRGLREDGEHEGESPMSVLTEGAATTDYDIFSMDAILNAHERDAAIREQAPVVYLEQYDFYVTGRHDLSQQVLQDWQTFSSASRPFHDPNSVRPEILLVDDPPRHTQVKNVILRALSPAAMKTMKDTFQREADRLVDEIMADGTVELEAREDLVGRYILKVFPDMLGMPAQGRQNLLSYGGIVFNTLGPENALFHQTLEENGHVLDWVARQCKREALDPDGIAAQMYVAADNGEITQDEAELLVLVLLSAGSDSTIVGITGALRGMAEFPAEWEKLKADPAKARLVLEEAIRWQSITRMLGRVTTRDVELGGTLIPKGSKMGTMMVAANRDHRRWDRPADYQLDRKIAGHMGFGAGIHACVGQAVARLEAECFFRALSRRVDRIEITGAPEPVINNIMHGTVRMPITLHAA